MKSSIQQPAPEVTIKHFAPITVAAVRHVGPYAECATAFTTLCIWAQENNLNEGDRQVIGISHDDPRTAPAETLRYDACLEVPEDFTVTGTAKKQTIQGGRYACCIHKGSYQTISQTFAAMLGSWFPESGEELTDTPPLEVYLNDPSVTPEHELLTELRIPLK